MYCQGFHGHHLTILNDHHSPNTDGIDPDSTVDVVCIPALGLGWTGLPIAQHMHGLYAPPATTRIVSIVHLFSIRTGPFCRF